MMMTKVKKQSRKIGDIVEIDLGDGMKGFGRLLSSPLMAFYDFQSDKSVDLERVLSAPILFRIWVAHNAITSGRWKVIANRPLEESLLRPVDFFKFDSISVVSGLIGPHRLESQY